MKTYQQKELKDIIAKIEKEQFRIAMQEIEEIEKRQIEEYSKFLQEMSKKYLKKKQ